MLFAAASIDTSMATDCAVLLAACTLFIERMWAMVNKFRNGHANGTGEYRLSQLESKVDYIENRWMHWVRGNFTRVRDHIRDQEDCKTFDYARQPDQ